MRIFKNIENGVSASVSYHHSFISSLLEFKVTSGNYLRVERFVPLRSLFRQRTSRYFIINDTEAKLRLQQRDH